MSATSVPVAATSAIAARKARIRANRRVRAQIYNGIATGVLWTIAGFITLVFVYICWYTISQGLPSVSLQFFTSAVRTEGIASQLFNTLYLIVFTMLIMIPIGLGAAIFLHEYATDNVFTRVVRFATDTLTSTPTIIAGMIGFLVLVTHFGSGHFLGQNRLTAALTLTIINLPWALRLFEEAIRAVPPEHREASYGIGATKLQTVARVVLPGAIPGFVTALLILAGRIIGESAALLFTASQSTPEKGWLTLSPFVSGETLALHAYTLFLTGFTSKDHALQLGTSLTLIVFVLVFNLAARFIGSFVNTRLTGRR